MTPVISLTVMDYQLTACSLQLAEELTDLDHPWLMWRGDAVDVI